MKKLSFLMFVFILFYSLCFDTKAQTDKKIDPVCAQKGHVKPATGVSTTLMLCPKKIVEFPDSIVQIYGGCNTIFYNCMRCHKGVAEQEKETRVTIWRKEK
jgi:hypothetical protein